MVLQNASDHPLPQAATSITVWRSQSFPCPFVVPTLEQLRQWHNDGDVDEVENQIYRHG